VPYDAALNPLYEITYGVRIYVRDNESLQQPMNFNTDTPGTYNMQIESGWLKARIRGPNATIKHDCDIAGAIDTVNTWYDLAVTYDGAYQRVYKYGIEINNLGWSNTIHQPDPGDLIIMAHADLSGRLDGIIDVAYVYNRALSADEIRELYVNPYLPLWKPAAVSVWDMATVPIFAYHYRRRRVS